MDLNTPVDIKPESLNDKVIASANKMKTYPDNNNIDAQFILPDFPHSDSGDNDGVVRRTKKARRSDGDETVGTKVISNPHINNQIHQLRKMGNTKCASCQEEFKSTSAYQSHVKSHGTEHICPHCGTGFNVLQTLSQHMRRMHLVRKRNFVQNWKCLQCQKVFTTKYGLNKHLKKTRHEGSQQVGDIPPTKTRKKKKKKPQQIGPKERNRLFIEKLEQEEQDKVDINHVQQPSQFENKGEQNNDETNVEKTSFPCSRCNSVFSSEFILTRHLRQHDKSVFTCPHCMNGFSCKSALRDHKSRAHPEDCKVVIDTSLYTCEICNASHSSREELDIHKRRRHHHGITPVMTIPDMEEDTYSQNKNKTEIDSEDERFLDELEKEEEGQGWMEVKQEVDVREGGDEFISDVKTEDVPMSNEGDDDWNNYDIKVESFPNSIH